jgi:hypothetical protein
MDHSKTTSLRLQVKNKIVFGLGQLQVTLTGVITHGHGDEAFVQCFDELWPNDLNFMIESLLRLFHSLEKEPIRELRVLFEFEPQNALFQQIVQGSSHCLNAWKHVDKIVGAKPLLRKVFFQMDNCVKDNNNHHFVDVSFLVNFPSCFRRSSIGVSCSWAHT